MDEANETDRYLIDHNTGEFGPVVVPRELADLVARGLAKQARPGWYALTRAGKARVDLLFRAYRKVVAKMVENHGVLRADDLAEKHGAYVRRAFEEGMSEVRCANNLYERHLRQRGGR